MKELTEKELVKFIGEQIGYGNMMNLASKLWREDMIANGCPISGVFVPALPCDVKKLDTTWDEISEKLKEFCDKNDYTTLPLNIPMPMILQFLEKNYYPPQEIK
jgi:hypothetical protein